MIRVAIIGLGAAAKNIHLPAYSQLRDEVSIVAGCDIDIAARTRVERKWRIPEIYDNPEEMIEKTHPDVVSICTPPSCHYEQTLMALTYGCHVFCEKPLVESLSQADEIIQASEQSKRFVVVNNQFPYMNIYRSSKRYIGSSEFGKLLYLHAWQTFRPSAITEAGWRGKMQRRLCFEFGVHVFELIRFFFEDIPVKIFAHMPNPQPGLSSEPINMISLEFADGRAASIVLDRLSKGPERYLDMRLNGEYASIYTSIGGEVRFEAGIHTRERRPFIGFAFVKGGKAVFQNGNRSRIIAKDGMNPFAAATAVHFRNYNGVLKNGGVPAGTARDHRNTLALIMAAYNSAQTGRSVMLNDYLGG